MTSEKHENEFNLTCGHLTTDVEKNGGPIKKEKAGKYLINYLKGVHDGPTNLHNYGYLFGLKKMKSFMQAIDAYNAAKPLKAIAGVRIYVGRKAAIKTGVNKIPMEKIMDSLFLMPVLTNGKDLYTIHNFTGKNLIIGNPRPCPNECKSLYFLEDEITDTKP